MVLKHSIRQLLLALCLVVLGAALAQAAPGLTRKAFAAGVENREPVGVADTFKADVGEVYFFNQVTGVEAPTTLTHVWFFEGQEVASVELNVGGNGWRTWSSKKVLTHQLGQWKVEVRDASGGLVDSAGFTLQK